MANEIWKDIAGYEGRYQVSNLGRVKSLEQYKNFGKSGLRLIPERILKEGDSKGYKRVVLCVANKRKTVNIHRLVAEAFIPNPNNLPQVNHIDENKSNNSVDNLEWVTSKENINHGTSLAKRSYHQRYTQRKIRTVYQYDLEDNLVGVFFSSREAARLYGFDRSGIQHCCNNEKGFKTYKGFKWSYEEKKKEEM